MKTKALLFSVFISLILLLMSCQKAQKADLILTNGTLYTVDSAFSKATCVAIKDGLFVAVGTEQEVCENWESSSIVDLEGGFVYPGFIDAHCHFFGYGEGLLRLVNLFGTTSFEVCIERLTEFDSIQNPDWLIGRGWDQNDWKNSQFPNNKILNKQFPNKPVYLTRIDGHAAIANDYALQLAGIDNTTKIKGGEVVLENGKPTGVLIDNAMTLVREKIPHLSTTQKKAALKFAEEQCFAVGLTSVVDCGLDKDDILLIDTLQKSGELKMQINAMLSPTDENFEYFLPMRGYKTDRLHVNCIKLYADGALGSRGALLLEPYNDDPQNQGFQIETTDYYRHILEKAKKSGFQVATHAIGDSANRLMLSLYSEFLSPNNDLRWRIEHAQIVAPEDFSKFKSVKIIPSVQPTHATSDMYWAEQRIGPERIKTAYAYRNLLEQNGWIPLGTDFPIEQIDPMLTFIAATTRKDINGFPEDGFFSAQKLTPEETLKGMTIWAAKGSFEADEKGSIEVGKKADLVLFQKDILTASESELTELHPSMTIINGEVVFEQ